MLLSLANLYGRTGPQETMRANRVGRDRKILTVPEICHFPVLWEPDAAPILVFTTASLPPLMKRDRASADMPSDRAKRGEAVPLREHSRLLAHKMAVKQASASSRQGHAAGSRSRNSFVPPDAEIKVSRWPKL